MVCFCCGISRADDTVGIIDLTNLATMAQQSAINSSVSSPFAGIGTDYSFDNSALLWNIPVFVGGDTSGEAPATGFVQVGWVCPGASATIWQQFNTGSTLPFPPIKTQCPSVGASDQRDMWFCLIHDGTNTVGIGISQGSNISVPAGSSIVMCAPANIVNLSLLGTNLKYAQCANDSDVGYFNVAKTYGIYYWDGGASFLRQTFKQFLTQFNLYVNMRNGEASGAYRVGPTQDLSKLDYYYTKTTTTTYVDVGEKLTLKCPKNTNSTDYLLPFNSFTNSGADEAIHNNLTENQLAEVYKYCGDTYSKDNSKIMCKISKDGTPEELTTSTKLCVLVSQSTAATEVASGTSTASVVCSEFDCELTQCWEDLNCEEGFYLPYGKAKCEPCPQGYYCSGYKNGDQNWCYADSGSNTFGNGTIGGHGIESCVAVMGDSTATTDAKANPSGEPDNGCNADCGATPDKCCASKPTACYIPCKEIEYDDNNTLVPKEEKVFYKADADNKCKYSVAFAYKQEGKESESGCNVASCCDGYPSYTDVYGIESLTGADTYGRTFDRTAIRDSLIGGRAPSNSDSFALVLAREAAQIGGRGTNSKSDYLSLCTPKESDDVCGEGKDFEKWELYSIYNVPDKEENVVALKPKCKPKTYNITYKLDGGEWPDGSPTKNTYTFGENFKDNKPTKRGYVFKGWKKG